MNEREEVLRCLYKAFNSRDIDGALAMMHPEVVWANGLEGGYVHGPDGVRQYWLAQWSEMQSCAEPISIQWPCEERAEVDVHVSASGQNGEKLFDMQVRHVFHFKEQLIVRFEIVLPT